MHSLLLFAVSITWSVMHPVWPDLDYFKEVVAKADAYGGVDSFEACGRCASPNGGLNGFLLYEPYPSAAAEVDRDWVAKNRKLMNDIVETSHRSGRPFYYWHREIFMPKGVLKDVPELMDADGEFDLLGEPYAKYLRWKVGAAFDAVPGLDGIVLTLTEADFSVIHNSNQVRYPPVKVVEHLVRIFAEEHEKRGKRLIVRSFGSIAPDYEDIIAGAKAAAIDHRFEIETKVTAYDFDPFLPNNPFLRKVPGTTLGAECDSLGEYFGAGYFPAAQVPVVARYVADGRRQGVDRYTIRIDRVGNSIFDTAQEINLYAYMRFVRDPQATVEQVTDEWAAKRWPRCAAEMKRLATLGFEAVRHTQFIDESVAFHQNPPSPNFKYVKACGIFSIFRDGFDLHQTERFWGMLSDRKAPGRKAILAEKDRAVAEADEGLALIRSVKDRLDPAEYARHERAWRNIALVAKSTRAYTRCACAYFDDMDANAADAPKLTAAVAAAVDEISSIMRNPNVSAKGYSDHCTAMGEDMDIAYLFPHRWFCTEFLREYRAEFAARQKFLKRKDVVDFVIPGGMYDDVRCWRTAMHASYQDIESGVPVRYAGNGIFPNGAVRVEFKDVPGTRVEIDLDTERGAKEYALSDVTSNGVRHVTISKKGAQYPAIRSIALVKKEPVLVVCAHPDDTIAMAGTLLLMKDRFDIHVADLTKGQRGLGEAGYRDGTTAATRMVEEANAAKLIDASVHWYDFIDGELYATPEACEAVRKLIVDVKPRAIFAMWPIDRHMDHSMAGTITLKAVKLANYEGEFYYYEQVCGSKGFVPKYYVDTTKVIEDVKTYIRSYVCQNQDDGMCKLQIKGSKFRGYRSMYYPKLRVPYVEEYLYSECFSALEGWHQHGRGCVFNELPAAE